MKKRNREGDKRLKLNIVERLYRGSGEAKRLKQWQADLIREIGGEPLTVAKRELVEMATRLKLAVDRADLKPTLKALDLGDVHAVALRRALMFTLKLLGLTVDKRVVPVKPQSKVSQIREQYRQRAREQAQAAEAGKS